MHTIPKLPYAFDALEPYISEKTMQYHYSKHHQGYFDKLNQLIQGTADEQRSLTELVRNSTGTVFNNAAQASNHIFYWDSLSPTKGQQPQGNCLDIIQRDFGSVATLKEQFSLAGLNTFGSGWAWLVLNTAGQLEVRSTANAHTPLEEPDTTILLACDVWEHAYYLDTQNNRAAYLENFWSICNWSTVNAKLAK